MKLKRASIHGNMKPLKSIAKKVSTTVGKSVSHRVQDNMMPIGFLKSMYLGAIFELRNR